MVKIGYPTPVKEKHLVKEKKNEIGVLKFDIKDLIRGMESIGCSIDHVLRTRIHIADRRIL